MGEFVAVVGTSGSGKSTLLHMLGGLDRPTAGTVTVDGEGHLLPCKDEELTIFRRRKIGFVFQNYNLVPVLNVYENIVLPIQLDGRRGGQGLCPEQIVENAGAGGRSSRTCPASSPAASSSGWPSPGPWRPSTGHHPGGRAHRQPGLPSPAQDVLGLLKVTGQKFTQTIVMITHNEEIAQMADRIIRIEDGRIVVREVSAHDEGIQRQVPSAAWAGGSMKAGQDPQPHRRSRHRPDHGAVHVPLHHRPCPSTTSSSQVQQFRQRGRLLPRRLSST